MTPDVSVDEPPDEPPSGERSRSGWPVTKATGTSDLNQTNIKKPQRSNPAPPGFWA
jgi:hypothetical protein